MGWARANILFDRHAGVPDAGSPMEILFLVLWRMRQEIEFQKSRVMIQSLLSQEGAEAKAINKAFEDLRQAFFPFEESQKKEEIDLLKKAMYREISKGPLSVKPMMDLTKKSVLQKLEQGSAALTQRASMLRDGRLKKLDQSLFEKARKRSRKTAS